jgi:membrane protease YdiL (CAAX protease family)
VSSRTVSFDGGLRTLTGFLLMTVAALVLSRYQWPLVPTVPVINVDVLALLIDLSLLGIVWWALKRERVSFETLGISTTLVVPGVVAVVGFYVALNLVAATLALTTVGSGALGYQWTVPPLQAGIMFVYLLIVAGVVEEVVFRGYLQSKLVALLGDDSRVRIGLAVLGASALFMLSHAPRVLFSGVPGSQSLVGYGMLLLLSGLIFGMLYELTENLTIPVLVHTAGNMPGTIGFLFVDVGALPGWATITYLISQLALLGLTVAVYRRWGRGQGFVPVWGRRTGTAELQYSG